MSATLTRSSLDSYLNLNTTNSNTAKNGLISSFSNDNRVDFSKALSVLTNAANKGLASDSSNSLSSEESLTDTEKDFFSELSAYANGTEKTTEEPQTQSLSSLEERFSVLNGTPKKEEWELLENKPSSEDYSILSKLGDGLLTAVKFAAGTYLGKLI